MEDDLEGIIQFGCVWVTRKSSKIVVEPLKTFLTKKKQKKRQRASEENPPAKPITSRVVLLSQESTSILPLVSGFMLSRAQTSRSSMDLLIKISVSSLICAIPKAGFYKTAIVNRHREQDERIRTHHNPPLVDSDENRSLIGTFKEITLPVACASHLQQRERRYPLCGS